MYRLFCCVCLVNHGLLPHLLSQRRRLLCNPRMTLAKDPSLHLLLHHIQERVAYSLRHLLPNHT